MAKNKPFDVDTRKEATLTDVNDNVNAHANALSGLFKDMEARFEERIDRLYRSEAARKDTTKRFLIGVLVITVAVNVGWDLLKAWLF